jgi:hypothetical protein
MQTVVVTRRWLGLATLAMAAVLAGCATVSNPLSLEELKSLRISGVDVVYAPEASIYWPNAEQEYVASVQAKQGKRPAAKAAAAQTSTSDITAGGGVDSSDSEYAQIAATPEAKQHLRDKLAGLVKTQVEKSLMPHFNGTREARIEVAVHVFNIPPAVQRVVLGGTPALMAVTTLKDAATGKELAKMDRGSGAYAGNGLLGVAVDQFLDDLEVRVIDAYGEQLRQWLLKQ